MYPGRYSLEHRTVRQRTLEVVAGSEPVTTALFSAAPRPGRGGICRIDALGREGRTWTGDRMSWEDGVGLMIFECAPEDIREFRIVERERLSRIVYRVPQVKGLPPENAGCENLLDLRIPASFMHPPWFREYVIRPAIMDPSWEFMTSGTTRIYREELPDGITVRKLLDHVYDGDWRVENNRLVRGRQVWRGGPMIRKIVNAARTLRE